MLIKTALVSFGMSELLFDVPFLYTHFTYVLERTQV